MLYEECMLLTSIKANWNYECKCDTSLGEWTACTNEVNCSDHFELEIIVMSVLHSSHWASFLELMSFYNSLSHLLELLGA